MNPPLRLASSSIPRFLRAALLALPFAIVALAGCGGTVNGTSGTGGGGTGGGGTGGGGTGAGGGGGNAPCSANNPCDKGICIYAPGTCTEGAVGVCQDFFQCDGPATGPICGCDGKTIEGEYPGCGMAGPRDTAAGCQVGTFACGPALTCKRNSEVCVVHLPGAPGPSTYECLALASTQSTCVSGIPACNCLDLEAIGAGATCQEDADFQDTVTVALP